MHKQRYDAENRCAECVGCVENFTPAEGQPHLGCCFHDSGAESSEIHTPFGSKAGCGSMKRRRNAAEAGKAMCYSMLRDPNKFSIGNLP